MGTAALAFAFDFTWRQSVNCESHVSGDINHVKSTPQSAHPSNPAEPLGADMAAPEIGTTEQETLRKKGMY